MMTSEAEEQLKLCRQEFTEFAYKISHDLQAPLRSIIGFSNFLNASIKDQLDEQQKKDMSIIMESAAHAQALIDVLLHYSQLQMAELSTVKLSNILEDVMDQMQNEIVNSGAMISYDALPEVIANPTQMQLLLKHLLSNAIKFHKPDTPPVIQFTCERETLSGSWKIAIIDNGIGIEKEHQKVVFQLLRKLHADETYPGLGTGLAYAKRIIELHHGEIGLDSSPGMGTTVWFRMPCEPITHA